MRELAFRRESSQRCSSPARRNQKRTAPCVACENNPRASLSTAGSTHPWRPFGPMSLALTFGIVLTNRGRARPVDAQETAELSAGQEHGLRLT